MSLFARNYFKILPVVLLGVGFTVSVQASAGDNVSGFAWSENIGWISFNSKNCDANGDGKSDGTPAGCPASGAVIPNYGVTISSNGNFSGYAWSENIGWIQFNPSGPYPVSPNYSACLDSPGVGQACDGIGNYNAGGWARVLSYGDGWDGWIKLRGTTATSTYGVSVDKKTGKFSGYAWSDMVVGWISFSGTNYGAVTTLAFNSPPSKPNQVGSGETWNNCSIKGKSISTFSWTYSDPDGDPQTAYEIEVDDNSSFAAPKFNHLVNLAATSYALDLSQDDAPADWISQLAWNTDYFWRVRVKDSQGNWSDWSSSDGFRTPDHAYPWPDFTWAPIEPTQGETVSFNPDSSTVYGGATISSYLWSIIQGTGNFVESTSASSHYPKIQFSTSNNRVKLQITDDPAGYSCGAGAGEGEKDVTAELPLPEYQETRP